MRFRLAALVAGLLFCSNAPALAESAKTCEIHYFPASRLQSVGEDFDAVHKLDQDLKDYERAAGRPLGWLTVERQLELARKVDLAGLLELGSAESSFHDRPLSRFEALRPAARVSPAPECHVEVMVPQILMERGGLATRSLRVFGVVRRYDNGTLSKAYTSFAAAPLAGFRLKEPADLPAATAMVEQAFTAAVSTLLARSQSNSDSRSTTRKDIR